MEVGSRRHEVRGTKYDWRMSVLPEVRVTLSAVDDDSGERRVISLVWDGQAIGFVEYRAGHPANDWLTIEDIELEKGYRGWGYGSEAVRLLEEMAVERGLGARFRADVDVKNGLALYFWLRLGYRPATNAPDTFVMVRAS